MFRFRSAVQLVKCLNSAFMLVGVLCSTVCMWFTTGDHVALLVNNLGSTSELEMNIVTLEAIKLLGSANDKHVCLE